VFHPAIFFVDADSKDGDCLGLEVWGHYRHLYLYSNTPSGCYTTPRLTGYSWRHHRMVLHLHYLVTRDYIIGWYIFANWLLV